MKTDRADLFVVCQIHNENPEPTEQLEILTKPCTLGIAFHLRATYRFEFPNNFYQVFKLVGLEPATKNN